MKTKIFSLLMCLLVVLAFSACDSSDNKEDLSPLTDEEIAQMFTEPEQFQGRTVTLTGIIVDTPEKDDTAIYFQMYNDVSTYDNLLVVVYENADISLKTDMYVKVTGTIDGTLSGDNVFGVELTAPQISATTVEEITAMEAIPAKFTVESDITEEQFGCSVTLQKVEFAETETRIYVSVTNNGSDSVSLDTYSCKIVQNGKQIDSTIDSTLSYPELSYDLLAGVSSEGIICFPVMEQSTFDFILTGYANDYMDELNFCITVDMEK